MILLQLFLWCLSKLDYFMFVMLKKIICLVLIFYISFGFTEPRITDYKKYPKTNSEYKLLKIDVTFEHPWGISSINNEEMIITEKGGGLFKFNKKTTE